MAHTFTNIVIHALFSTKQRRPFLDAEMKQELFPYPLSIKKLDHGRLGTLLCPTPGAEPPLGQRVRCIIRLYPEPSDGKPG